MSVWVYNRGTQKIDYTILSKDNAKSQFYFVLRGKRNYIRFSGYRLKLFYFFA